MSARIDYAPPEPGRGFAPFGLRSLVRLVRRYWLRAQRRLLPRIAVLSILLLLFGAFGVYVVEQGEAGPSITSYGDALWYGIVTMSTVGYGDLTPKSVSGRLIGAILILGGMGLVSLFTATVASALVARQMKGGWGLEAIRKMRNHVLVCGWNQHAGHVLEGLLEASGKEAPVVLVNELPEEAVNDMLFPYRDRAVHYVHGDPAAEAVLTRANVRGAKTAIVLADTSRGIPIASDERTTLVTLALKSLKPEIKVTAEVLDVRGEAHLRRAGADDIVISGEFNGFLLSSAATTPGMSHVVRQLLSRSGSALCREPIPIEFVGRTFGELFQALRSRRGFLTLAIVSEKEGLSLDDLLTDDYSLVDQFIKTQFSQAGKEYLRFEEGGTQVVLNPADSYVVGPSDTAIGIPGSR